MFKKNLLIGFLFLLHGAFCCQVRFCAWNIQNFGKSKSDSEIVYMAGLLRNFDVVGLVEVVSGQGGAQAVARLADELNRTGAGWDYVVSDPTCSRKGCTERYAFLWKPSAIRKKADWLDTCYQLEIEREPYFCSFEYKGKPLTLAIFHALPASKQPETEIKFLKFLPGRYRDSSIVFAGDFNCPQSHTVFNPLKKVGWSPALSSQKTTLKMKCKENECLASEFDNIFYPSRRMQLVKSAAIQFYQDFPDVRFARTISDHLPVFAELELR